MSLVAPLNCFGCVTEDDENGLFEAQNHEVADYCKSLVNARFTGETSNIYDNATDHNELQAGKNLGNKLQAMDSFIRGRGDNFTGNEHEFLGYMEEAIKIRCCKRRELARFRKKIARDKTRFVELLRRRRGRSHFLHHVDYWGTRQQLRAGKVIGDWIDRRFGALDPIFGSLLCPTAGRTGPGDSDIIHEALFDEDGPIAYHSAAHDAFGYLLTHHDTGPGYKYLEAFSIFDRYDPYCEQVAGVEFWMKLLQNPKIRKQATVVY